MHVYYMYIEYSYNFLITITWLGQYNKDPIAVTRKAQVRIFLKKLTKLEADFFKGESPDFWY